MGLAANLSRHNAGNNTTVANPVVMRGPASPTLLRAVDSSVAIALKKTGKQERVAKKQEMFKTKEMDLTDIISRLETANK